MKIIVVYKSKYGSSQEYATWLGEELRCEVKRENLGEIIEYINNQKN
jgi:menaquinone-dependent protoporphyrinogen IX oxidase